MPPKRKLEALRAPSEDDWNSHKDTLQKLYLEKTLPELMRYMKSEHDFVASKNQYERKLKDWGLRKNLTADEWEPILGEKRRRDASGKGIQVTWNGITISGRKIEKEERRHHLSELDKFCSSSVSFPEGISISTPPPSVVQKYILGEISFNNLPSLLFLDFLTTSGVLSPSQQINSFQPVWSPFESSTPRIVDLDDENISVDYFLGLPPSHTRMPVFPPIPEKTLQGFLDVQISQPEKTQTIIQRMGSSVLERYEGEFAERIDKLLGPSYSESFIQFTSFVIHLFSNNVSYSHHKKDLLLGWITTLEQNFLQRIFSIKSLAVQTCLEALLSHAVTKRDSNRFRILHNADTSESCYHGRREELLLAAVQLELVDIVQTLLGKGLDVNCRLFSAEINRKRVTQTLLDAARTTEMARLLLDAGADVNALSWCPDTSIKVFCTPIDRAIYRGNTDLVEILQAAGADFDPGRCLDWLERNETQLQRAIKMNKLTIVKILLEKGKIYPISEDAFSSDSDSDPEWPRWETELKLAASLGYTDIVDAILKTSLDKDSIWNGICGCEMLVGAAMNGNTEMVKLLIAAGANVNASQKVTNDFVTSWDVKPSTALMGAIEKGNTEVVEILLQESVDVNGLDFSGHGISALEAAENLDRHHVSMLLRNSGALKYPARSSKYQVIELRLEARMNNLERVQYLVSTGIEACHILDALPEYFTNLNGKIVNNVLSVFLKVCGTEINAKGPQSHRTALQIALQTKQSELARNFILAGARMDISLSLAIAMKDLEITKLVLEAGADVKASSLCDLPFTRWDEEDISFIDFLVQTGIDINAIGKESQTILQDIIWYSTQPPQALIRFLVDRGADANAGNMNDITSFEMAISKNLHIDLIHLLIEKGADVNKRYRDCTMETPLQIDCRGQCPFEVIQLLLDNGADVNAAPGIWYGRTALQAAITPGYKYDDELTTNLKIIQLLLDNGADINAPPASEYGKTALQAAVTPMACDDIDMSISLKLAQFLLDRGADVHAAPSEVGGLTALQGASITGHLKIAHMLLERGADPNAPGSPEEGRTALEGAAEHGRLDMIQLLLNAGAEPTQSAVDLAEREKYFTIADFLKDELRKWEEKRG